MGPVEYRIKIGRVLGRKPGQSFRNKNIEKVGTTWETASRQIASKDLRLNI